MTTIDWVLVSLALCLAAAQLYYGIRYREFFVVSKETISRSYWSMILEFKQTHPKAGGVLAVVVWLQVAVVLALAVSRVVS